MLRVLFNRWFTETAYTIRQIRNHAKEDDLCVEILGSGDNKGFAHACDGWIDLEFVNPEQYLREVQKQDIDVFFVRYYSEELRVWLEDHPSVLVTNTFSCEEDGVNGSRFAPLQYCFTDISEKPTSLVLTGTSSNQHMFDSKFSGMSWIRTALEYVDTWGDEFSIGAPTVVMLNNKNDVNKCRDTFGYRWTIKLDRDIGGVSFRTVVPAFHRGLLQTRENLRSISIYDVETLVESSPGYFIGMPYLEGYEESVDCLIHPDGVLTIARRKLGRGKQLVYHNPVYDKLVKYIADKLELRGPFNLQFIYSEYANSGCRGAWVHFTDKARPNFLECNLRMAAGVYYDEFGGICYPYEVFKWALGMNCIADSKLTNPIVVKRFADWRPIDETPDMSSSNAGTRFRGVASIDSLQGLSED